MTDCKYARQRLVLYEVIGILRQQGARYHVINSGHTRELCTDTTVLR
jgi:hypothetical protein